MKKNKVIVRVSDIDWAIENDDSMPISITYVFHDIHTADEIVYELGKRINRTILGFCISYDANCMIYETESSLKYREMNISVRYCEITDVNYGNSI